MKTLKLTLIQFLWASGAHKFSLAKMASETQKPLAKMASETQKPLAKMELLLVCGWLATISLEPCQDMRRY